MKRCKGCGKEFRKGAIAFLLVGGKLAGARVCQDCAKGGVLICAPKVAPAAKKPVDRRDGVDRALRMLRTLAKASEKIGALGEPGSNDQGIQDRINHARFDGRAEGFEGAIEVIKRECGVGQ